MRTPAKLLSASEVVQTLRALQPEIRARFRAEVLGAFGSFARGEQSPESEQEATL